MSEEVKVINLDLGSGASPVGLYERKPGELYILFDMSREALKIAKQKIEKLEDKSIKVDYVLGRFNLLPFRDGSISHIEVRGITLESIYVEHESNRDIEEVISERIAEIARVLKPNGTVTMSTVAGFVLKKLQELFAAHNIYFEKEESREKLVTDWEKKYDRGTHFLLWTLRKR